MSPRPYNLGVRHEQVGQGRRQILDAARSLLGRATSYTDFTVNAVAARADVARGTVYYQFKSKTGLLEALCDDLAHLGGLADLPRAFADPDPDQALAGFVACFGRFWQADRDAMRRLRALAALDPEVRAVIGARDERRRAGLTELAGRFDVGNGARKGTSRREVVAQLQALTSFETFDAIAGVEHDDLTAVTPTIVRLARAAIAVD